ncbi:MAG: PRC-barrel domain-containing protein [Longimicrobiales bacterium]|nr:PRC-barrel domain-containing protein [Longimicrobiales bacterium]
MLRSLKGILGYPLLAEDGEIGRCRDFLFDDAEWVVRYLEADTGKWIPRRRVLIAPTFLDEPDWPAGKLPVSLTKHEIEAAPPSELDLPVSRQHEEALADHFEVPRWWEPPDDRDGDEGRQPLDQASIEAAAPALEDPRLRSLREVRGYDVQAVDGALGHVEDLMADDADWSIRYLVVDTGRWLPGRKVLISPLWLRELVWSDRRAVVELTRDQIEDSPPYRPRQPIYRAYEAELHEGYGLEGYWEE